MPAEYVRVYGGWEERLNPNFQRQAWFRQRSRRLSSITPNTKIEEAVRRSASEESLLDTPPPPTPPRRPKPEVIPEMKHCQKKIADPIKCSDMNGKCGEVSVNKDRLDNGYKPDLVCKSSPREQSLVYTDDKFGRHPPLRKVTAVHCEVVSETPRSQYKDVSHSSVFGVNGVKKLSLSSADLNFSPVKPVEQSFISSRSGDVSYSPQRLLESYSPPSKSTDHSFSRSLEQSYSSSSLYNQSQRSTDSTTISDQSCYNSPKVGEKVALGFGAGDYYIATKDCEEVQGSECDDSSTLSDDDCTPHVSRSNSRGNEVTTKLRHLPPVHVETCFVRGRLRRKEERAAHRSRSLPPPPPYRPPPPAISQNRRAPITSYYLGDCSQSQRYVVTRTFMDEESYV